MNTMLTAAQAAKMEIAQLTTEKKNAESSCSRPDGFGCWKI